VDVVHYKDFITIYFTTMPPFTSHIESEYISIVTNIVLSLIVSKMDWIGCGSKYA